MHCGPLEQWEPEDGGGAALTSTGGSFQHANPLSIASYLLTRALRQLSNLIALFLSV